ncbi:MAG: ABC transporter permease, partial [Gemmatimonadota bacterium]
LRSTLVAGQMAGTVILLIAAGLFLRALRSLETLDTGWSTEGVQVASFDLEYGGYGREQGLNFYNELVDRVRELPGVEAAGLARKPPLGGRSSFGGINVAGVEAPQGRDGFTAYLNTVTPGYFETLDIALLQGRDISDADTESGRSVAVINQAMAQRFWPGDDAIGRRFHLGQVGEGRAIEVVGVVENVKYSRLVEETPNFYYLPLRQWPNAQMTLHLRTAAGAGNLAPGLRRIVRELDAGLPILSILPLDEALEVFLLPQRMAAWVTGIMGFIGLLLGAVGIYGVTAFAIGQRTREIGIRVALGARTSDVVRMMAWQGMIAPLAGMGAGLAIAFAVTRFLVSLIPGVSPVDPLTFGSVIAGLFGIALFAILLPAGRAARLDPSATLRSE